MLVEHSKNSKQKIFFLVDKIQNSEGNGILIMWKNCFLWSTKVVLHDSNVKRVVLLHCTSSGATRTNFPVQCTFVRFSSQLKRCFHLFLFQNFKILLVSHIFLSFSAIWLFKCSSRCCLIFLGIIFNTYL